MLLNIPSSAVNLTACITTKLEYYPPYTIILKKILSLITVHANQHIIDAHTMSDHSVNMSTESPDDSHPTFPATCYLPCTVETIFSSNKEIDALTLYGIACSLIQTIKNQEEAHCMAAIVAQDTIQ